MRARLPEYLRPVRASALLRLGEILDGGYVVSEDAILASDFLVSFGISTNWEFEKAFRERRKQLGRTLAIHAYDHTVDAPFLRVYRFKELARYCLSLRRCHIESWKMARGFDAFFDGTQATHFKEKVWSEDGLKSVAARTIMGRVPNGRHVFIKMDIEGSEYRVVGSLAGFSEQIVGLVIEFHDLDILRSNFESLHQRLAEHYDVVHVHANNVGGLGPDDFPNILEITYEHTSLGTSSVSAGDREYPLAGIDKPNCLDRPDFTLDFV
jgi:hypothetical protein